MPHNALNRHHLSLPGSNPSQVRRDALPPSRPVDIYQSLVHCPGCGAVVIYGNTRQGEPRMCVRCSTLFRQPVPGGKAERATVEEFNKAANRAEASLQVGRNGT